MKEKLSKKFWWALAVFSLMGQVAWVVENMYFNVFIYKIFHAPAADISAMVAASAVTATLTTVLMGALSDRIAKRKLFIWLGYVLWGVSIFLFVFLTPENVAAVFPKTASAASLGVSLAILLDCVMTFFGSSANDAAFNAWLTDSTSEKNRGAAEGINAMMPLVAILVVFGSFLFFDLDKPESWKWIFGIIGAAVIGIGLAGIALIDEAKLAPSRTGYWRSVVHGFLPKTVLQNKTLYLALAIFVLFNISIQIFMPYLILYYEVSLQMSDYVLVMAPAIVIASAVTALWGRIYDRKGLRFSGLIALFSLLTGYAVLYFFRSTLPVFIGSLLMMCGYLSGMAVFGAQIRDLTPKGKAGMFQGIRICSQVLVPGVIGPYIGKTILQNAKTITGSDGTVSFIPDEGIFLGAFFAAVPVLIALFFWKKKEKPHPVLTTEFEEEIKDGDVPFSRYPRPLMVRDSYLCLNGNWALSLEKKGKTVEIGTIRVPFPPQSRLSGIKREIQKDETLIYQRRFELSEAFFRGRTLLHFGAVDQRAEVFLNGERIGENKLPYLPFSLDITSRARRGENELTVRVSDPLDRSLPWGKQSEKRGGMWYTPVSGLWQTVWIESCPIKAIESIRTQTTVDTVTLDIRGGEKKKTLILHEENRATEYRFEGERFSLTLPEPRLWTPESPYLYRFALISGEDRVESYFALREISLGELRGKQTLLLNRKPYYFHGVLDQGYFPDGIFLPATERGFENDILQMKSCGFNMLRKHIKLEPELFYYDCDRLGMAVFQDMIQCGAYSFFLDTALPTLGIRRGITHRIDDATKKNFLACAEGICEALYSHPCVLYYTIFNEGWGQFDADACYRRLKALDPSRIWDATSGWFAESESDVQSEHIYFKPVTLRAGEKPTVLSEFGGYSLKMQGHVSSPDKSFGYRFYADRAKWQRAIEELYRKQILPAVQSGVCATVLTQLSDVEDETNGILTYDRRICKADPAAMRAIAKELKEAFAGEGEEISPRA